MTKEYLDHMTPVAAKEADCAMLNWSTGLRKSLIPAITRPCNKRILQELITLRIIGA